MKKYFSSKLFITFIVTLLLFTSAYFVYAVKTVQDCINYCGETYGHDDELFAACYYGCVPSPDPSPM